MTTGMADLRLQLFHCLIADSKTLSLFLFMVFAIITNSFEFPYLQCVHTGVSPTLFYEGRSLCLAISSCFYKMHQRHYMSDECIALHGLGASARFSPHHHGPVSHRIPCYVNNSSDGCAQTLVIRNSLGIFHSPEPYFSYLQLPCDPTYIKRSII